MRENDTEIKIRGMICRACADDAEAALINTRGVIEAKVSYLKGSAKIKYDPDIIDEPGLCRAVESAGYETGDKGIAGYVVDIICIALTALIVWLLMHLKLNAVPQIASGASLAYVFLVGLLTSTHCVVMCGGIMLSQSGGRLDGRGAALRSSAMYNGGRLVSYTLMGAVCGALGMALSYTMHTKAVIFTLLGALVMLMGLNMWGLLPGLDALKPRQSGYCAAAKPGRGPLIVGLLTGLMPCGALYSMWMVAVTSGSAISGGAVMLAFALGTVPLMLLFGALGSLFPRKAMKYMLKLGAVLVTAYGIKMLINGINML